MKNNVDHQCLLSGKDSTKWDPGPLFKEDKKITSTKFGMLGLMYTLFPAELGKKQWGSITLGRGQKWKENSKEEMPPLWETGLTKHLYSKHKQTEDRAEYFVSEHHEAVHISTAQIFLKYAALVNNRSLK